MAKEGKSAQEILTRLLYLQNHLAIYFIIDSLEYLRRGGRIGKVTALAGKLMGIKPVLSVLEGEATNVNKVRGMQTGLNKLVDGFLTHAVDLHRVIVISSCDLDYDCILPHTNACVNSKTIRFVQKCANV